MLLEFEVQYLLDLQAAIREQLIRQNETALLCSRKPDPSLVARIAGSRLIMNTCHRHLYTFVYGPGFLDVP